MELDVVQTPTAPAARPASATSSLIGDDFLKLLVAQLANQDPLNPTSNESLLQQLSSIREIELSQTLSDSLKTLTQNQRYGAVAALIGKHVVGSVGDGSSGSQSVSGTVTGIRFGPDGSVTLELDSGVHLIAYALLAFFALLPRKTGKAVLFALLAVIAYGGLIEYLQPYVNRYGELGDFLANGTGAGLGWLLALGVWRLKA